MNEQPATSYCVRHQASDLEVVKINVQRKPWWICRQCSLNPNARDGSYIAQNRGAMLDHMQAHRTAGHRVPVAAMDLLRQELQAEQYPDLGIRCTWGGPPAADEAPTPEEPWGERIEVVVSP